MAGEGCCLFHALSRPMLCLKHLDSTIIVARCNVENAWLAPITACVSTQRQLDVNSGGIEQLLGEGGIEGTALQAHREHRRPARLLIIHFITVLCQAVVRWRMMCHLALGCQHSGG